jgi:hypothetical protein
MLPVEAHNAGHKGLSGFATFLIKIAAYVSIRDTVNLRLFSSFPGFSSHPVESVSIRDTPKQELIFSKRLIHQPDTRFHRAPHACFALLSRFATVIT